MPAVSRPAQGVPTAISIITFLVVQTPQLSFKASWVTNIPCGKKIFDSVSESVGLTAMPCVQCGVDLEKISNAMMLSDVILTF